MAQEPAERSGASAETSRMNAASIFWPSLPIGPVAIFSSYRPGEERGLAHEGIGAREQDESDGGDRGKDLEPGLHVWMSTLSCSK